MNDSRREFLKKATVAGTGLVLGMSAMKQTLGNGMNGKKVKLAFIGTGDRGRYLMELLMAQQEETNYEITAICDNYQPSIDLALSIGAKYGVKPTVFMDHRRMIGECPVDGVVIATPLFEHAHIAIDCMNAGIHVLCEKAMARTLDDVKAMYDTHLQTGAILQIGHQRLFSKVYQTAMERIHRDELGAIAQIRAYWHRDNSWRREVPDGKPELERKINWRLYKEYSAGVLTELMSHQLQVANWVLQKTPVSVMASGAVQYWKDGREVPDNVAAIFTYDDGAKFMYDTISLNRTYGCEEHVIADKGTMTLETNVYKKDTPPPAPGILQLVHDIEKGLFSSVPIGGASWVPETALKYNGEKIYVGQKGDGTTEELTGFIHFVRQKSMPEWMTIEGYNTSIWTLLCEQAMETQTVVTCPEQYILKKS